MYRCVKKNGLPAVNINTNTSFAPVTAAAAMYTVVPDSQIRNATIEEFLEEIAGEKPIRFTAQQLAGFTNNYSARLVAGGFGTVYKGMLPNGHMVAVKRLHVGGNGDGSTSQEQFMAEVGSIGRIHHINLVSLPARHPAVCSLPVGWPAIEECERERGEEGREEGKGKLMWHADRWGHVGPTRHVG
uniref:Protein kinase domain-containing protein n=1 Tax=Oryza rufipogon TaxID=4529 RepID=A0A0E0NY54_ORYRU